eukprot:4967855-Pyramimonas_sp.AAC.1
MAEIVRAVSGPWEVPASALNKHPFLSPSSFQLGDRQAPKMLADGSVQQYIILPVIILARHPG